MCVCVCLCVCDVLVVSAGCSVLGLVLIAVVV